MNYTTKNLPKIQNTCKLHILLMEEIVNQSIWQIFHALQIFPTCWVVSQISEPSTVPPNTCRFTSFPGPHLGGKDVTPTPRGYPLAAWSFLPQNTWVGPRSITPIGHCLTHRNPMGRTVYLPIHEWLIFMVNVGKYTIHGSYG